MLFILLQHILLVENSTSSTLAHNSVLENMWDFLISAFSWGTHQKKGLIADYERKSTPAKSTFMRWVCNVQLFYEYEMSHHRPFIHPLQHDFGGSWVTRGFTRIWSVTREQKKENVGKYRIIFTLEVWGPPGPWILASWRIWDFDILLGVSFKELAFTPLKVCFGRIKVYFRILPLLLPWNIDFGTFVPDAASVGVVEHHEVRRSKTGRQSQLEPSYL